VIRNRAWPEHTGDADDQNHDPTRRGYNARRDPLVCRSRNRRLAASVALGWSLKSLALRANAFAIPVIRLQSERAHTVAESGPYAVVRHPFYAADPLILIGMSVWDSAHV
jgi:hypothetical protein